MDQKRRVLKLETKLPNMLRVAIIGSTGYTGLELCRLLVSHKGVSITHLFAHSQAGKKFGDLYPHLTELSQVELEPFDSENLPTDVDIYFLSVPHATAHAYCKKLWETEAKIIDLSADYRLDNLEVWEETYKTKHESPELIKHSAYGIPELYANDIKASRLVANPGCYATSAILPLTPLVKAGLLKGMPIVDAKSGVSGAGRATKVANLYCEANETIQAYGTGVHRHQPEIEEKTGATILFSPHLTPMSRGILATIYSEVSDTFSMDRVKEVLEEAYGDEPFIHLFHDTIQSSTAAVSGTNNCFISYTFIESRRCLVLYSALDNLLKGAAGQAIQNMNLMCGFEQKAGLDLTAPYL